MCGRYVLTVTGDDLRSVLPGLEAPDDLAPRYNVAPTQAAAVVPNDGRRQVRLYRWGLVPPWAKDRSVGNRMINARCETLAQRPAYRKPLRSRRCLVLADGFYEWRREGDGTKTPMLVRRRDGRPFTIAGLWERWRDASGEDLHTFTIVTGPPNGLVAPIHDRMPVILPGPAAETWIDPAPRQAQDLLPLLVPFPEAELEARPVSRLVNSPANDVPECVEPVAAAEPGGPGGPGGPSSSGDAGRQRRLPHSTGNGTR